MGSAVRVFILRSSSSAALWKTKIGLSHAVGTYLECPYDKKFFPEMYSVAKNASPSFARFQIYTFFHNNLKKSKFKNRA